MIELPDSLLKHTPWENESNPIWLASSFLLHRNLARFHFPPKMSERELQHTLAQLKEPLLKSPLLQAPTLLQAEMTSPLDKEYLFEHFLCMEGFQNTLAGQGFIVDNSGTFFGKVNILDHLQLQLIDNTGSWEKIWNKLSELETAIGTSVEYAFSSKFGYLTSDPNDCGTGLTTYVFLHLPALVHTHQLEETLLKQKEEGVEAIGMGGNVKELTGDILILSNNCTLGVNEESTLHSIHGTMMKLMALEKSLRTHLQTENNAEIKDQVSRAFGLLLHSYQLQTKEALDALSLVKLALSLGWVEGITDAKLNTLFFQCRRAHLLHLLGQQQTADPQEVAQRRAEFLHKNMQGVILKI